MAPGGSSYQDIGDSRSAYADYGIAPENAEPKSSPFRKSTAVNIIGGNHGTRSNTAVHELLECPVCMNLMYPPIHQVGSHVAYFGMSDLQLKWCEILESYFTPKIFRRGHWLVKLRLKLDKNPNSNVMDLETPWPDRNLSLKRFYFLLTLALRFLRCKLKEVGFLFM